MMQQWADHLDELRAKDGKVVAFEQVCDTAEQSKSMS